MEWNRFCYTVRSTDRYPCLQKKQLRAFGWLDHRGGEENLFDVGRSLQVGEGTQGSNTATQIENRNPMCKLPDTLEI